ncbi:MAG: hypothetical protein ACLT90_16865 [Enterococcus raffinosus]
MIHVFPFKNLPVKNVLVASWNIHGECRLVLKKIKVAGVGSHGSMPEVSIDPINVATKIYLRHYKPFLHVK